ncbi:hypothetical protein AU375_03608 [Methylobacterium radiotolerans]|nr:hypothetical protein AU375_03608 [Methylobacterium radiotolerans]
MFNLPPAHEIPDSPVRVRDGPSPQARDAAASGRSFGTGADLYARTRLKTLKRDYAHLAILADAETVMRLLPAWFEDYNTFHPHSGVRMLSPREYLSRTA